MRYAALKAIIAIILGIILAQYITIPYLYIIILIVLAFAVGYFTKWYSLYFALLLVSSLNFNGFKAHQTTIVNFPLYDSIVKIQVQIIEEPIGINNRYTAKLLKINDSPLSGKVFLYLKSRKNSTEYNGLEKNKYPVNPVKEEKNLSYGDIIEFKSKITAFDYPRNPNLIDYNAYFHKQGFIGSVFISPVDIETIIPKQGNWIMQHFIIPIRSYFFKTIDKYLDGDEKNLLLGMILGEKRGMSKSLRATFADVGVAHIFAVSGLHVAILIGILLLSLPIFRIRGFSALIIIILITVIYLSLIGFRTSAVRAGLMAIFAVLGIFLERRYESLNGIFVAAIIILLISPQALFDVGFQLSFSAVTAIILITPRLYSIIRQKNIPKLIKMYILLPLFVSFSATIGAAPLILYHFFRFPILVIFANLLVVPLVGIAIPLGFLLLLFNLFFSALAGIYTNTLWLTLKSIIFISEKFANLSFSIIEPGRPSVLLILIFYLAVMFILFWKNLRFRRISLALFLIGLNLLAWQKAIQPKHLSVTFLDVRKGDAIFFNLPNERKMLIDAGEDGEIVSQFLKSKGIKNIDLAVITHPHLDHYGGYRNLLDDFKITNFLIATEKPKDTLNKLYSNLIDSIRSKKIKIYFADRGQVIRGLGVKVEILSPDASIRRIYNMDALNPNDISIVLKLEYNNTAFLFPGDLDDAEFIKDLPIQAKILKSPHHASKKANSKLLFDKVKPEYIIITGRKKVNQDVLNLIEQNRIKTFNIRKDGALTIKVKTNNLIFH